MAALGASGDSALELHDLNFWDQFLRMSYTAIRPNKVTQMNATTPNVPTEPTTPEKPTNPDFPDDAGREPLPPDGDEPGESDELDPEEPVGTPGTNQPTR